MAGSVVKGVTCPACGGSLEIVEGMTTLKCRYCDAFLLIRGEKGVLKLKQRRSAEAEDAVEASRRWFRGIDKARDLRKRAVFDEPFLIYLPFWRVTGKVLGWVFGDKIRRETVRVGNRTEVRTRREPVERIIMKEYVWTNAACDVSEFGVESIEMPTPEFSIYHREVLEREGMIFEPTEAESEAQLQAESAMRRWGRESTDVDEITYERLKVVDLRTTIVYYPLWVLRYDYKGRTYQMLTDGATNEVLYGRAPGSTLFRVSSLVGTMFVGNLILTTAIRINGLDYRMLGTIIVLCLLLMAAGFWKFRYSGEVKKGGRRESRAGAAQLQELRKLAGI